MAAGITPSTDTKRPIFERDIELLVHRFRFQSNTAGNNPADERNVKFFESPRASPAQNPCENQRGLNGGVRFDDEFAEYPRLSFSPGDFFIKARRLNRSHSWWSNR